MASAYDVVTFDCYGTLIDWETGIGDAVLSAAAAGGVSLDRAAVLAAYAEIEPEVQAGQFQPYRGVLADTARRIAARFQWPLARDAAGFLATSLPAWPPFGDTNPALERLDGAGLRLGILSNVDDDLLEGTRQHFTVPFALVVTAAQVRSYKPAPGHFHAARDRLGGARWLHVAQSWFHDVEPAAALGIAVAWINRKAERGRGGSRPTVELRDLAGLADWLGA